MTFDAFAADYDANFSRSPIVQALRDRLHQRMSTYFAPGEQVLEMGCGTGDDARRLAGRGVHVTATDVSEAMLDITAEKVRNYPHVDLYHLDLNALAGSWADHRVPLQDRRFDGAFANFGVLNGVQDRRALAAWLGERVQPGGVVAFGVMSPYCAWEMLWHGAHRDFKTAFRRWRDDTRFVEMPVAYPNVKTLTQEFAPYFTRVAVRPVGLFLPTSDAYAALEKRPRLMRFLLALDNRLGRAPAFSLLADHYWVEFERHAAPPSPSTPADAGSDATP